MFTFFSCLTENLALLQITNPEQILLCNDAHLLAVYIVHRRKLVTSVKGFSSTLLFLQPNILCSPFSLVVVDFLLLNTQGFLDFAITPLKRLPFSFYNVPTIQKILMNEQYATRLLSCNKETHQNQALKQLILHFCILGVYDEQLLVCCYVTVSHMRY